MKQNFKLYLADNTIAWGEKCVLVVATTDDEMFEIAVGALKANISDISASLLKEDSYDTRIKITHLMFQDMKTKHVGFFDGSHTDWAHCDPIDMVCYPYVKWLSRQQKINILLKKKK